MVNHRDIGLAPRKFTSGLEKVDHKHVDKINLSSAKFKEEDRNRKDRKVLMARYFRKSG